jgi:hypothetical protein
MIEYERRQFMETLYYGGDMYLTFQGEKYFVDVGAHDEVFTLFVYNVADYGTKILDVEAATPEKRRRAFLAAKIFQGHTVLEEYTNIRWTDE